MHPYLCFDCHNPSFICEKTKKIILNPCPYHGYENIIYAHKKYPKRVRKVKKEKKQ